MYEFISDNINKSNLAIIFPREISVMPQIQ